MPKRFAARAPLKAQAAQHALQVQGLQAEMGRRFDAMAKQQSEAIAAIANKFDVMATKQQEQFEALDVALKQQSEATEEQFKVLDDALKQQSEATEEQFEVLDTTLMTQAEAFDVMATKQQKQFEALDDALISIFQKLVVLLVLIGVAICGFGWNEVDVMLSGNSKQLEKVSAELMQIKYWAGIQPMKQHATEVDSLLRNHSNRPLKALWEALNDKANPEIELAMAIIMDPRCGIERKAELADGPMRSWNDFTINTQGYEGATPLIMAVQAGRNDVARALLANGAGYEATFGTIKCWSALHIAAIINNVGAIELLASFGADVSKPNKIYSTPLHSAAYYGNAAAIEALVELRSDLTKANINGKTPLRTFVDASFQPHTHVSKDGKERLKAVLTP